MTKIVFTDIAGKTIEVDAEPGTSVMEAALANEIDGINADCGGYCSCATCHVYVDEAFADRVGGPSELEAAMLDCKESHNERSRLCCQIEVTPELEGLHVTVAD